MIKNNEMGRKENPAQTKQGVIESRMDELWKCISIFEELATDQYYILKEDSPKVAEDNPCEPMRNNLEDQLSAMINVIGITNEQLRENNDVLRSMLGNLKLTL